MSSVISYGLILWGNSVDVEKVFKIQKKCVRAISGAYYLDSCRPLFQKFNILPLACMYIRELCLLVKSHPEIFKLRSEVSTRHIRAQYINLVLQPPSRTDIYKKNVVNMCIQTYNYLPNNLKLLQGPSFKNKLTAWLMENCFYNLNEFMSYVKK